MSGDPSPFPCPKVPALWWRLTLGLQLSKVTQDGAEGWPLGPLIGQALAGKHGQLWARGFRQLVLLLVEVLFLWGRGPEVVNDPTAQVPFPKRQNQTPRVVGPCSVILILPTLSKEKPTCLPLKSKDLNPSLADSVVQSTSHFSLPVLAPTHFCSWEDLYA